MKYYLFDRTYKIIHFDDLSNLKNGKEIFSETEIPVSKNEVYILQLAALSDCDCTVESVTCTGGAKLCCINTDVTDKYGNRHSQKIKLKKDELQPLFFTVETERAGECVPEEIKIVTDKESTVLKFIFKVNDMPIANRGYNDL